MHHVGREIVHLHRLERAGPDVQVERHHGDALGAERVQQLGREVQPGGGRRNAAFVLGIDRLVALAVSRPSRAPDIGRERDLTVLLERRPRVERAEELHTPQSTSEHLDDLDGAVGAEPHRASRLELPARMSHGKPRPVGELADEQELGDVSRFPFPVQSRRDDP